MNATKRTQHRTCQDTPHARRFASPRAAMGLAVVGLAAGACRGDAGGSDATGGEWNGSMRDSAGVTLVENTGTPLWGEADAWTLVEELRIGREGDPDYQFGQLGGAAILDDGRIVVIDQQAQHLRVFSANGTHLRTIGEAGSGPGQFALGAGPVLAAAGDTIFVPDPQNQRVHILNSDLEFAGSFRVDFSDGFITAWALNPQDELVTQIRHFAIPGQQAEPDTMDAIVRRDGTGAIRDTVFTMPAGKTFQFGGDGPQFEFFTAEPVWTLRTDGSLVFGVNNEYRLRAHDASGELERVFTKPFEQRLITPVDQTAMKEALERIWENAGVPPQQLQILSNAVGFAEYFPAYARFIGGPENTTWVQHILTPSELTPEEREDFNPQLSLGAPEWDIFGPDGRYLWTLTMPDRFQPLGFEDDRVYGVWRDDLEIQYLMVMRIDGIESGGPTEAADH